MRVRLVGMEKRELDIMVLEGVVLLPESTVALNIFEPRYLAMLEKSLQQERTFAVGNAVAEIPAKMIGLGLIQSSVKNKNGTYQLILKGVGRYRVQHIISTEPLLKAECEFVQKEEGRGGAVQFEMREKVRDFVRAMGEAYPQVLDSLSQILEGEMGDSDFCDLAAGMLVGEPRIRQELMETVSVEKRLTRLCEFLDTARLIE